MIYLKILAVTFWALIFSGIANTGGSCFIASQNNHILVEEGDCDKRYPPCCTFKIAISLMGFDAGILRDETHPTWNFKPGYAGWSERWKQPHNPTSWLANSCAWYSQIITEKLGMKRFADYTKRFNYGNKDTSGDKGMGNGLTHCWLSSSLVISPREQIHFLEKLIKNQIPVSLKAQEMTKNIMFVEALKNDWTLYGKTGNGSQLDANSKKMRNRQVGWFVGFVRKGSKVITFAYLLADDKKQETYASLRAKAALKDRLTNILMRVDDAVVT